MDEVETPGRVGALSPAVREEWYGCCCFVSHDECHANRRKERWIAKIDAVCGVEKLFNLLEETLDVCKQVSSLECLVAPLSVSDDSKRGSGEIMCNY